MRILIFFTLSLISLASYSQAANTTKLLNKAIQDSISYRNKAIAFIKEVRKDNLKDTSFILVDKPFNYNTFTCFEELSKDVSTFSKQELQFIRNKKFHSISSWAMDDFTNIKQVKKDSLNSIFAGKGDGWEYFYTHFGKGFHSFSYPIFLRNDNYCIFYFDNSCGWLCGVGWLSLYKKVNDKWVELKTYCNWVS